MIAKAFKSEPSSDTEDDFLQNNAKFIITNKLNYSTTDLQKIFPLNKVEASVTLTNEKTKDLWHKSLPIEENIDLIESTNIGKKLNLLDDKTEKDKDLINITINKKEFLSLPSDLKNLANEIEKSKRMLNLKNNWDGEGSLGYKQSTWIRAIKFVVKYSKIAFIKNSEILGTPKIYEGPAGTIDILWKNDNYRLLINIPANDKDLASFYGDDYQSENIQGAFDTSKLNLSLYHNILNNYYVGS